MAYTTLYELIERGEVVVATAQASQTRWAAWRKESHSYKMCGTIESRVLVTYTGSYIMGYRQEGKGWTLRWLTANSEFGDMYSKTAAQFKDRCDKFLQEILDGKPIEQ